MIKKIKENKSVQMTMITLYYIIFVLWILLYLSIEFNWSTEWKYETEMELIFVGMNLLMIPLILLVDLKKYKKIIILPYIANIIMFAPFLYVFGAYYLYNILN
ncbi:MAG: hypothetical protein SOR72_03720 [Hornefia sp.]|nr:hypothetical protein [Hornefia sp.]